MDKSLHLEPYNSLNLLDYVTVVALAGEGSIPLGAQIPPGRGLRPDTGRLCNRILVTSPALKPKLKVGSGSVELT